jgi:formate hydrogenlyase subunit 3/multisubunit Na+/H+ antiporter MnhD subunit
VNGLLLVSVALPLLLGLAWPIRRLRPLAAGLSPWAALPATLLALLTFTSTSALPEVQLPWLFLGFRLALDEVGRALLLLTASLWLAAGAFAACYHRDDPGRERFFVFFVLTMAGNLVAVLAGDLLTFYLAFAVMTFSAYGLVVHRRDRPAERAGRVYIVLALVGEVLILSGLFALGAAGGAGGLTFGPGLVESWSALGGSAPLVASLLIAGFGVKAGIVPLHLWLPLAHPVAPTAASALLSGVMVKVGLLGWIRVLVPASELARGGGIPPGIGGALATVGAALAIIGLLTTFWGIVVGLTQEDPKSVLAYSTVSQIGTMAIGVGAILLTPGDPAVAVAAVVFYALHHGVAKGALFLSVGVFDRLPTDSGRRWGSLARPAGLLLLAGVLVPSLALAGAPLTSGVMAKGGLKAALAEVGGGWYATLDPLLVLAATGTTLLLGRFLYTLPGMKSALNRGQVAARPAGAGARQEEGVADAGRRSQGASLDDPSVRGLVLPWGSLILATLTAPLWLAGVHAAPAAMTSVRAWDDVVPALLPVLVGGVLIWVTVTRTAGIVTQLRGLRVPPGDILVLLEVLTNSGLQDKVRPGGWKVRFGRLTSSIGRGLERWVVRLVSHELMGMRGAVVGSLMVVLIVGLVLSLAP